VTTSYSFLQSKAHILRDAITKYSPKSEQLQYTFIHIWKYYYTNYI